MEKTTHMLSVLFFICIVISNVTFAQEIMKIEKKDKSTISIPVSDIAAITFSGSTTASDGTVKDVDGNLYKKVTIGSQTWMAENLRTTKLNDGTAIVQVSDNEKWKSVAGPAFCWYENKEVHKNPYGALYNGYVVLTDKVCPAGWRVPNDADWNVLQKPFGNYAGIQLKEKGTLHWEKNSTNVTNETGFTAVGSGYRSTVGLFTFLNGTGLWWTSSLSGTSNLFTRAMWGENATLGKGDYPKTTGASIRCIKE